MTENISLAFQGIWGHKMRSFLTMLGIIIGIAAIITIVSTIKGTNEQIKQNLIGSGTNVVTVKLKKDSYAVDFDYESVPDSVTVITEDVRASLDDLDGVEETSLFCSRSWCESVYCGSTAFNGNMLGVDRHYFSVNGCGINYGRGFTESDFNNFRNVAILDSKTAVSMFDGQNPIGKTVEIKGVPFVIVGVASPKVTVEPVINSVSDYYMYADTGSGTIYIPITSWPAAYRFDEPQNVSVRAKSTDDMTAAGNNVANSLNEKLVSGDTYAYKSDDLLEQAASLQSLSESSNKQLVWIAAISLLVGGIGVMNIMLVSVTERIKEIGLKLSIGARQSRILWQFLTEAAVLTSLGGIMGVGSGIGLSYMLSKIMGTPVAISAPACLVAVGFSMVIGIVFGLVPAVKASKMNPIEALRRE